MEGKAFHPDDGRIGGFLPVLSGAVSVGLPADDKERRVAGNVSGVDVGAGGEESLDDAGMTLADVELTGEHQRREIVGNASVEIRRTLERRRES